jgi:hypothetical protein
MPCAKIQMARMIKSRREDAVTILKQESYAYHVSAGEAWVR